MTQNDNAEDILAIAANWKAAGEDVGRGRSPDIEQRAADDGGQNIPIER